jgi:hypothetical protein
MSYIASLKPYIAESGLLKIDDTDSQVIDGIETCINENGIYFLALACIVAKRTGEDYKSLKPYVTKALQLTKLDDGLYGRNVHGFPIRDGRYMLNSFDNILGMCALSLLFELDDVATELDRYGSKNWWNYNNSTGKYDIKAQIQGGEIQIIKLARQHLTGKGGGTNPFLMTWFLGGLKLSEDEKSMNASRGLLQWVRYWCLVHCAENLNGMSGWMWDRYKPTFEENFMDKWSHNKDGSVNKHPIRHLFRSYFWDEHPMVVQTKKLEKDIL